MQKTQTTRKPLLSAAKSAQRGRGLCRPANVTDMLEEVKNDPSISLVGNGVVANNNSIAVGKIRIGGNVDGNFTIGNQVNKNRK